VCMQASNATLGSLPASIRRWQKVWMTGLWRAATNAAIDRPRPLWPPNYLARSLQPKAKAAVHEIWMVATKAQTLVAFAPFVTTFEAKYPKAAECLVKDREALLAFYDFPAEHWILRCPPPADARSALRRAPRWAPHATRSRLRT